MLCVVCSSGMLVLLFDYPVRSMSWQYESSLLYSHKVYRLHPFDLLELSECWFDLNILPHSEIKRHILIVRQPLTTRDPEGLIMHTYKCYHEQSAYSVLWCFGVCVINKCTYAKANALAPLATSHFSRTSLAAIILSCCTNARETIKKLTAMITGNCYPNYYPQLNDYYPQLLPAMIWRRTHLQRYGTIEIFQPLCGGYLLGVKHLRKQRKSETVDFIWITTK